MKRLYLLVPTVENANAIAKDLQKIGIAKSDVLLFGKDLRQIEVPDFKKAGLWETSDLLNALIRGIVSGGIAGVSAGILVVNFPPAGLKLGLGIILGLGLFGIFFGAWVSTLIGVSVRSPLVKKYEKAIEGGELLILVEVPEEKELHITTKIKQYHPEAKIVGTFLKDKVGPQ